MKLCWANAFQSIGNGYGYTTHARMLREACERAGVESAEDGEVAVHIITPDNFRPVPGRKNLLYTMYEATTLPEGWKGPLQVADLIVVPCRQNRDFFRQYTKVPIEVCWEGVDTELYRYVERKAPMVDPFIFLWVGAPNPRKGFGHAGQAWDEWGHSGRMPRNAWAYFKTSGIGGVNEIPDRAAKMAKGGDVLDDRGKDGYLIRYPAMHSYVDTRNLSPAELFGLYERAHAFMLPSMGEGFGLTLAEAMSTGLPCIFTPWGGPRDFCSEKEGFPVKWRFRAVNVVRFGDDGSRHIADSTYAASADYKDVMRRMEQIYADYPAARARGRRAAERIRAGFTWDISAARFMEIINLHFGGGRADAA